MNIAVSGAGTAAYNGVYTPSGTVNGATEYQLDAGHILYFDTNQWYLGTAVRAGTGHTLDGYFAAGTSAAVPTTGWTIQAGTAPAPTVGAVADTTPPVPASASVNAAGTQLTLLWTEAGSPPVLQAAGAGTNQGLTLVGTDGASVVSAVVTTGTTTTATLGRTILAGEALHLAAVAAAFTDSAGTPNATAAFAGFAVTNNSTHALTQASAPEHIFSTGTLVANWVDGLGAAQTATFAILQDISTDLSFTRKELMDAAQISIFAIDCADSDGKLVLKAGTASISADTLQRLIAATLTPAAPGSTASLVLPREVVLPAFQAVLTLMSTGGKTVTVTAGQVKALGTSLALKLSDFQVNSFELHCYPDGADVIAVWQFQN